jgi:hypothetical protein
MIKLKPCPFCGNREGSQTNINHNDHMWDGHSMVTLSVSLHHWCGHETFNVPIHIKAKTEEDVITRWNTRSIDS